MPHSESSPPARLHTITASNPSPYTLEGTNTYLVGTRRIVVVDPGPDDAGHVAAVLEEARRRRAQIALIAVTHGHGDHLGGARALADATGAPVARWHDGDRPLADGELIEEGDVRLRVLHTPGHAPDHVVFVWDEGPVLFSGDLILGRGTAMVSPPGGSMEDYLRSLDRVLALSLSAIAPGHGPWIDAAGARVAEYIAHRRLRERQVLDAVSEGPRTPGEIAAALYPDLDPRLHPASEGTVLAHLLKLLHDGRVAREGNRYYVP